MQLKWITPSTMMQPKLHVQQVKVKNTLLLPINKHRPAHYLSTFWVTIE